MAKSEVVSELRLCLPAGEYPIIIGRDVLSDVVLLRSHVLSRQVCIVTNSTVAPLYLAFLQEAFAKKQCDVVILADGEEFKTEKSLFQIYNTLIDKQHHRDTTLVALGGGVVGDISGFAASTYQRGIDFVQIPTTLLAQVDASVGGKTAINHPLGKNMIGTFYQPKAVIMDMNTLHTLPLREFRAGLAEVLKYALLVGGTFFVRVKQAFTDGIHPHSPHLPEIISECCRIKAIYVQDDERESGRRALLNLGHTIAHALEAYTHYQRWLHGEAVAIGLYCAALLSCHTNGLKEASLLEIDDLLALAALPRRIPKDINLTQLRLLMNKDKKIKNNTLRFIMVREFGDCYLEDNVTETSLQSALQSAVEGE